MSGTKRLIALVFVMMAWASFSGAAVYTPMDFIKTASHLQSMPGPPYNVTNGIALPDQYTGSLTLGGIPFVIPQAGNNYWVAELVTGSNPKMLTIPVDMFGVSEVHTLINAWWGVAGPTSLAFLEFLGADGAYFRKDLVGNIDVRDYNQNIFTNQINNTTTTQVISYRSFGVGQRIDKQQIVLPADFHDETLSEIRLTDVGKMYTQRVFLAGLTVRSLGASPVPEPTALVMWGILGGLGMIATRRRRTMQLLGH